MVAFQVNTARVAVIDMSIVGACFMSVRSGAACDFYVLLLQVIIYIGARTQRLVILGDVVRGHVVDVGFFLELQALGEFEVGCGGAGRAGGRGRT